MQECSYCTTTETVDVAVCAPAVAVTVTVYVFAGVPVTGGGPPLLELHAANSAIPPTSAAVRRMRRARGAVIAKKNTAARTSKRANRETRHLIGANEGARRVGRDAGSAPDDRAVVVTVRVVPEMEQPPAGMVHAAVRVGVELKPLSLNWNVKVLPADPVCEVCAGVIVGFAVNVAVTLVFALIVKVQTVFVLPAQAPDQLVNEEFAFGTAVRVMEVPGLKLVPDGDC